MAIKKATSRSSFLRVVPSTDKGRSTAVFTSFSKKRSFLLVGKGRIYNSLSRKYRCFWWKTADFSILPYWSLQVLTQISQKRSFFLVLIVPGDHCLS